MAQWIKGLATSLIAQFSPLNPCKKLSAEYSPITQHCYSKMDGEDRSMACELEGQLAASLQ